MGSGKVFVCTEDWWKEISTPPEASSQPECPIEDVSDEERRKSWAGMKTGEVKMVAEIAILYSTSVAVDSTEARELLGTAASGKRLFSWRGDADISKVLEKGLGLAFQWQNGPKVQIAPEDRILLIRENADEQAESEPFVFTEMTIGMVETIGAGIVALEDTVVDAPAIE